MHSYRIIGILWTFKFKFLLWQKWSCTEIKIFLHKFLPPKKKSFLPPINRHNVIFYRRNNIYPRASDNKKWKNTNFPLNEGEKTFFLKWRRKTRRKQSSWRGSSRPVPPKIICNAAWQPIILKPQSRLLYTRVHQYGWVGGLGSVATPAIIHVRSSVSKLRSLTPCPIGAEHREHLNSTPS